MIVDAAISAEDISDNNKYYSMGNDDGVFIKSGLYKSEKYNNNLISKVWPETAVFMDWFNKKCMNVWSFGLYNLYTQTNFDGLWIDMNEPTTFKDGETKPDDATLINPTHEEGCKLSSIHISSFEVFTFKLQHKLVL